MVAQHLVAAAPRARAAPGARVHVAGRCRWLVVRPAHASTGSTPDERQRRSMELLDARSTCRPTRRRCRTGFAELDADGRRRRTGQHRLTMRPRWVRTGNSRPGPVTTCGTHLPSIAAPTLVIGGRYDVLRPRPPTASGWPGASPARSSCCARAVTSSCCRTRPPGRRWSTSSTPELTDRTGRSDARSRPSQ